MRIVKSLSCHITCTVEMADRQGYTHGSINGFRLNPQDSQFRKFVFWLLVAYCVMGDYLHLMHKIVI